MSAKERPCRKCINGTELAIFNNFWTCKGCYEREHARTEKPEEKPFSFNMEEHHPVEDFDDDEDTKDTDWTFSLDLGD